LLLLSLLCSLLSLSPLFPSHSPICSFIPLSFAPSSPCFASSSLPSGASPCYVCVSGDAPERAHTRVYGPDASGPHTHRGGQAPLCVCMCVCMCVCALKRSERSGTHTHTHTHTQTDTCALFLRALSLSFKRARRGERRRRHNIYTYISPPPTSLWKGCPDAGGPQGLNKKETVDKHGIDQVPARWLCYIILLYYVILYVLYCIVLYCIVFVL
jgi:hypothetical protein